MKQLCFILFLGLLASCNKGKFIEVKKVIKETSTLQKLDKNDTLNEFNCRQKVILPLSSFDSIKIGFVEGEYIDGTIGPTSFCVSNDTVFLVDSYFGTIKKIDLETGNILKVSQYKFSVNQPWLQDITLFKENIVITSGLGNVYFFNKNLELLFERNIQQDDLFILGRNEDSLQVYLNNSGIIVWFDEKGNNIGKTKERVNIWDKENHLFKYSSSIGLNFLTSKKILILSTIPLIKKYDSKNFFLDNNSLYYFDIINNNIVFYKCNL